jgi:hypothetical protein
LLKLPVRPLLRLAEQNHKLKRKLRHAVTVANGCARTLGRERAEAKWQKKERMKLEMGLIERAAHQCLKINPCCVPQGPTPEEFQERMAEEKKKREKEEHMRQARFMISEGSF